MNVDPGKWSTICAVVLSAAALLSAAPASADQNDDGYLAALEKHGIVITNRDSAIATGRTVCDGLKKGQTGSNLVLSIIKGTNLSARSAGYIISASVASYCPQYKSNIANSAS